MDNDEAKTGAGEGEERQGDEGTPSTDNEETNQKADPAVLQQRVAELESTQQTLTQRVKDAETKRDEVTAQMVRLVQALETEARLEEQDGSTAKPEDVATRFRQEFDADPVKALDRHVAERLKPLYQRNLVAQAQTNRELERNRLRADPTLRKALEKYEGDVEKFLAGFSPEVRAEAESYTNGLLFQMASRMRSPEGRKELLALLQEEQQATGVPYTPVEGASPPGPRVGERPHLSDLERHVMREMDIDEKDWLKHREAHAKEWT